MARPLKPITSVSIPEEKRSKHNALLRERLERLGITPSDQIRKLLSEVELVENLEKRLKWRLQTLQTILPYLIPKLKDTDLQVLIAQSVTNNNLSVTPEMSPEQLAAAEALAIAMSGPKAAEVLEAEVSVKEDGKGADK